VVHLAGGVAGVDDAQGAWSYSGVTVVLQWCDSGVTVVHLAGGVAGVDDAQGAWCDPPVLGIIDRALQLGLGCRPNFSNKKSKLISICFL
jgi:hypothetical protein